MLKIQLTGDTHLPNETVDFNTNETSAGRSNVDNDAVIRVKAHDVSTGYLGRLAAIGHEYGLDLDIFSVCTPEVAKTDSSYISRLVLPVKQYLTEVHTYLGE